MRPRLCFHTLESARCGYQTAIHELRKRVEKLETTVYTGNGKPSLLERFAALERAQQTQTWLLRLIVGGVLSNSVGLFFLILKRGA